MSEVWMKIYSKNDKLIYEGFTVNEMPFGSGTSYYSNGRKFQEGVFDDKGLLYGREYYRNGKLRFEGSYKHNNGYGSNYPVFGYCYDEDGKELFYGELTVRKSGLGWPTIVKPEYFGLTEPKGKPDFIKHKWESTRRKPYGKYYVNVRGKKERKCFIDFLERNGFKCEDTTDSSRENTMDSRFPITVDIGHKKYDHMGSITCAAAAATAKVIISAEEFYVLYEIVSALVIV